MKVNDTVQLLEASKSVASVIPVVGTQLAAAIDLTIKVCKLIEEVQTNKKSYSDLGERVALLVSAIVLETSKPEIFEKLPLTMESMVADLVRELHSIEDAVNKRTARDLKIYHGHLASARSSIHNSLSGLKHRASDKEEAASMIDKVKDCEQRFRVRAVIDNARTLQSIVNSIRINGEALQLVIRMQEENKQALERQEAKLIIDTLERKLVTVNSVQWTDSRDHTYCYSGTRTAVLDYLTSWAADTSEADILWISGLAGAGKSTLMRSLCLKLNQADGVTLVGSFFFSRSEQTHRDPRTLVHILAYDLAVQDLHMRNSMASVLEAKLKLTTEPLDIQVQSLLEAPLSHATPSFKPLVFVIDALDECDTMLHGGEALQLVPLLAKAFTSSTTHIKLIITSRRDPELVNMFKSLQPACKTIDLHDSKSGLIDVKAAISHYLEQTIRKVPVGPSVPKPWPTASDLGQIIELAGELFIFASTVVNFISKTAADPVARLAHILQPSKSKLRAGNPHETLDLLYTTALTESLTIVSTSGRLDESICSRFRRLVGSVILLQYPMRSTDISDLLDKETIENVDMIKHLHAVFLWAENDPIQILHPSFPEYLLAPDRCFETGLRINGCQQHVDLAVFCLRVMNENLEQVIDCMGHPHDLNVEADELREHMLQSTTEHFRYACRHWFLHISLAHSKANAKPELIDLEHQLSTFCSKNLFRWMEVANLLGCIHSSLEGYHNAMALLNHNFIKAGLIDALRELYISVGRFHIPLDVGPLEIYNSLPVFTPISVLYEQMVTRSKAQVKLISPRPEGFESTMLMALEGHTSPVASVAFSPDGLRVASGSNDKIVRIWNSTTGNAQITLEGHTDWVTSVVFSPDGMLVASGSSDNTVRIWDSTTGKVQTILHGHSDRVTSVVFSPNGMRVASGSDDRTVRIWDLTSAKVQITLEGHTSDVISIAFSPDGMRLASGSWDQTVQIWDLTTGEVQIVLEGHTDWVTSVTFSPDGVLVASGSRDHTVRIWDSTTGKVQSMLEGHIGWVTSVVFSPNGMWVASGSDDHTVRIWDSTAGKVQTMLEGHTDWVRSVAFSPDGIRIVSGSYDRTVRIWDLTTGKVQNMLERHTKTVLSVAFSPDGMRVASCSHDKTARIWESTTGKVQSILKGHTNTVRSIAFMTVKIWNSTTGKVQITLAGHRDWVLSVAFSPDGTRVASASDDKTVRIWDPITGKVLTTLEGHGAWVRCVAFSPDGMRVVSGSDDWNARIWDLTTGKIQTTLEGHDREVTCVAFSPDGMRVASGSFDDTLRIWDSITGEMQIMLEALTSWVRSVAFSPDGTYVIFNDREGITRLWDFQQNIPGIKASNPSMTASSTPFLIFSIRDGWLFVQVPRYSIDARLCWIPENRRPDRPSMQSYGCVVALGSGTGLVTILDCAEAVASLLPDNKS